MKLKQVFIVIITLVIMFIPALLHAQEGAPGDPLDPDAPIDGGLSILLAAGVGYGAKKLNDQRKKKAAEGGNSLKSNLG